MKHFKTLALLAALVGAVHLTACSDGGGGHEGHDHADHADHQHEQGDAKSGEHAGHDMDAAKTAASGAKPWPLKTCPVSGEELGSMGEPPVLVHNGQEVKFCCKSCIPKFEADPDKFLAKLSATAPPAAK